MRGLGFLLILLGVGSFVLHAFHMEFRLLSWIDNWGETTGNVIRFGIAGLGLAFLFYTFRQKGDEEEGENTSA